MQALISVRFLTPVMVLIRMGFSLDTIYSIMIVLTDGGIEKKGFILHFRSHLRPYSIHLQY
jgi:hypothetical protein